MATSALLSLLLGVFALLLGASGSLVAVGMPSFVSAIGRWVPGGVVAVGVVDGAWVLGGLVALAGIALGIAAIVRIRKSNGTRSGVGMAIVGISVGAAVVFYAAYHTATMILFLVAAASFD